MVKQVEHPEWKDLLLVSFDTPEEQGEAEALMVKLGGAVHDVMPPVTGAKLCWCQLSPGFVMFRREEKS